MDKQRHTMSTPGPHIKHTLPDMDTTQATDKSQGYLKKIASITLKLHLINIFH